MGEHCDANAQDEVGDNQELEFLDNGYLQQ